jgi:heptosyltransferase I
MINGVPRILIIRLSAIGDVVRVLPALHALRDAFPHAQIDWVVEPKSVDVVRDHPALDQCHVFERPQEGFLAGFKSYREICRVLRTNRYDIVLDFHGIFKSGYMSWSTGAKERLAFSAPRSREFSALFSTRRVKLISQRMNRIEENLELCKSLGAKLHALDVAIDIAEDVEHEIDAYVEAVFAGGKRLVMLHPPVERPEKQWPLEHFSALADMLLSDGRFEVMLTWGPGQLGVAEEVRDHCLRKPVIAPETPDLKHFSALVQKTSVFCTGDTGPMHIASAMGVPVVALFGGTDPAKHAPLRKPSEVFYTGPDSFPTRMDLETAENLLREIAPEDVYDTCVRMALEN